MPQSFYQGFHLKPRLNARRAAHQSGVRPDQADSDLKVREVRPQELGEARLGCGQGPARSGPDGPPDDEL